MNESVVNIGPHEPQARPRVLSRSDDPADREELRRRNAASTRLLNEWMNDESGYDEANWPEIEKGLREAARGFRCVDADV